MSPPALSVRGLAAPFGDGPGLSGIDLTVAAGERFAVVGASGAGKTTLLRAIAGFVPSEGGVAIGGRDVTGLPPERRDAVYLHQSPLLFPHLDIFENVAFPLRVRRTSAGELRERVAHALAAVRLEGYANRRPGTLSGGQRHRVALARAMVARPTLLLLDEPLTSLDPSLREEVREAILSLQREYRPALLLVTHDLDEAGLLADRIGVLLDRRLAQVATPGELFAHPASLAVARFLGIPNLLRGRITPDGQFVSLLGAVLLPDGPAAPPPGPAVAVFRPGALRATAGSDATARVIAILTRTRYTTALVRIGETRLEVPVDSLSPPAAGSELALTLDPRQVTVFPGEG